MEIRSITRFRYEGDTGTKGWCDIRLDVNNKILLIKDRFDNGGDSVPSSIVIIANAALDRFKVSKKNTIVLFEWKNDGKLSLVTMRMMNGKLAMPDFLDVDNDYLKDLVPAVN